MAKSNRVRIDGTTYITGELQALYYLINVGRAGLNDIADYCGLKRTMAHNYVSALQRKDLVDYDGTHSSAPGSYWCKDKAKAETLLAKVADVIDTSIKVKPPIKVVKVSKSSKTKINGVWFSLGELSILNCLFEAKGESLTPKEIVARGTVSTLSQVYMLLGHLRKKQLVDRKGSFNQYYYWCKDLDAARKILGFIDKALLKRR